MSQAALSNDDFRKMLAEAKPARGAAPAPTEEERAAREAKRKTDKAKRERKKEVLERIEERRAEQAEREEKYRDRAAERRAGKMDAEYADHEELLEAYKNMEQEEQLTEEERRQRAIEASKCVWRGCWVATPPRTTRLERGPPTVDAESFWGGGGREGIAVFMGWGGGGVLGGGA